MKEPRKVDQKITQTDDPETLLWHLHMTLNVAHTEAKLAFQRQLENYEILVARVQQIRDTFPKQVREVSAVELPPPSRKPRRLRKPA